jgi:hypothetical protein
MRLHSDIQAGKVTVDRLEWPILPVNTPNMRGILSFGIANRIVAIP